MPIEWGLMQILPVVFCYGLLPMLLKESATSGDGSSVVEENDDATESSQFESVVEVFRLFFARNALVQAAVFAALVNTPVFLSGGIMTYVDIGWPLGLTLIAVQAWTMSSSAGSGLVVASEWRRCLACGCMLLHGGRMFVGAVVMFGQKSKWTFRFKVSRFMRIFPFKPDEMSGILSQCVVENHLSPPILHIR